MLVGSATRKTELRHSAAGIKTGRRCARGRFGLGGDQVIDAQVQFTERAFRDLVVPIRESSIQLRGMLTSRLKLFLSPVKLPLVGFDDLLLSSFESLLLLLFRFLHRHRLLFLSRSFLSRSFLSRSFLSGSFLCLLSSSRCRTTARNLARGLSRFHRWFRRLGFRRGFFRRGFFRRGFFRRSLFRRSLFRRSLFRRSLFRRSLFRRSLFRRSFFRRLHFGGLICHGRCFIHSRHFGRDFGHRRIFFRGRIVCGVQFFDGLRHRLQFWKRNQRLVDFGGHQHIAIRTDQPQGFVICGRFLFLFRQSGDIAEPQNVFHSILHADQDF